MSEEIKYMKVRSRNATMIQLYGDKLKPYEWLISQRSNLLHMELQFSDRYGSISVSATKADGCDCVRFKIIAYSHAYRWSTILIPVTAEQEARIFADACRMADLYPNPFDITVLKAKRGAVYYGPEAIKYDTAGVSLSFISKRRWWNPSNERQWCNETVGLLLMVEWPLIFCREIEAEYNSPPFNTIERNIISPQEQTPDQTAYMIQYYFESLK
jgi:hypothetical protein